jgi:hypothetical protein
MNFDDAFAGAEPAVQKVAKQLRAMVREELPTSTEMVHGGKVATVLYSVDSPKNVICGLQSTDGHCVFFLHRVDDKDSELLNIEDHGQHAVQVRFAESLDADAEGELRRLIHLAASRSEPDPQ